MGSAPATPGRYRTLSSRGGAQSMTDCFGVPASRSRNGTWWLLDKSNVRRYVGMYRLSMLRSRVRRRRHPRQPMHGQTCLHETHSRRNTANVRCRTGEAQRAAPLQAADVPAGCSFTRLLVCRYTWPRSSAPSSCSRRRTMRRRASATSASVRVLSGDWKCTANASDRLPPGSGAPS